MNEKLKVEMGRYGSVLFGRVLEQPADLRTLDETTCVLADGAGFSVHISCSPELNAKQLYIRGSRYDKGNEAFCHNYRTEDAAAKAFTAFSRLIEKINAGLVRKTPSNIAVQLVVLE